jgi:hypothetical protein
MKVPQTKQEFLDWIKQVCGEAYADGCHDELADSDELYRYMAASFRAEFEREALTNDDYIQNYFKGEAPDYSTVEKADHEFALKFESAQEGKDGPVNETELKLHMNHIMNFLQLAWA